MNLNDIIKTEIQNKPPRILLYGTQGIGKSTFGANSPNPIFIPTEDGLTNINVAQFPLAKSWDDIHNYIGMLLTQEHTYKTFVLDTLDWLETLIWVKTCQEGGKTKIEDFGYGKGYVNALNLWSKLIEGLEKLREKGMAILLIAHSEIKTYNPPDNEPYERYQIKLHRHAASKMEEWADAVLFAHQEIYVDNKKAVGGERVLHTIECPAWKAKNRYSLPPKIDFNFNTLLTYIKGEKGNG
ncbi:MAG: hypothetical protein A3K77_00770 [Euryarchaeota archaeon RBG_13_31_8]|nr:MAG: hypothetical protein A3K77_00770 [Euryarchaeota archaeon RBG_13_31_8]